MDQMESAFILLTRCLCFQEMNNSTYSVHSFMKNSVQLPTHRNLLPFEILLVSKADEKDICLTSPVEKQHRAMWDPRMSQISL